MLMIYGVTGYTGALISKLAHREQLAHIAAGRNAAEVGAHAAMHNLPARVFALDDAAALDQALAECTVVLNCAGPFITTAPPLVAACLRTGTHYLDLAGEYPAFAQHEAQRAAAVERGVLVLPGIGFSVAPTDCLALHLKQRLPSATSLTLAFDAEGGVSQGTLGAVLGDLARPGVVRRRGSLEPRHAGSDRHTLNLGRGPRAVVLNPWRGDLVTAFWSTAIPNITTYSVFPTPLVAAMRSAVLRRVIGSARGQRLLKSIVKRLPAGPGEDARAAGTTAVWGEVSNQIGERRRATLTGPEAYDFTAHAALAAARRILAGAAPAGLHTPATAFGADWVLELPGVSGFVDS